METNKVTEQGYFVVEIDNAGRRVILQGYLTALGCAFALGQITDLDAREFARTWNGFSASGETRYEMGFASRWEVMQGGEL